MSPACLQCPTGYTLCGDTCINLATDPLNCGTTCVNKVVCSDSQGTNPTCAGGVCDLTCAAGRGNCNKGPGTNDGCEVDLTDIAACRGACADPSKDCTAAAPPGATATCSAGTCDFTVSASTVSCVAACVLLASCNLKHSHTASLLSIAASNCCALSHMLATLHCTAIQHTTLLLLLVSALLPTA